MLLKGKLIKCKREVKDFDGRKSEEKLFITLAEVEITEDQLKELKEAFKDSGKKFTPDWVLDPKGYVNVSTKYELPVRISFEDPIRESNSIEDEIKSGLLAIGAEAAISLNVKEGAVYPEAINLLSEGTARNPFAEFDN